MIETIASCVGCVVLHYYLHYSLFNGYNLAETSLETMPEAIILLVDPLVISHLS